MEVWKMIFPFKGMIFMFRVSFRGSMFRCKNMWNSKFHAQEILAAFCIIWIGIV